MSYPQNNPHRNPEPWFADAIARGIQRLMLLTLDRAPAAELATAVVRSWIEDLWAIKDWHQERDAWRVEEAFRRCRTECSSWPSLAQWRERIPPPRAEVAALPTRTSEERFAKGAQHVREIVTKLGIGPKEPDAA